MSSEQPINTWKGTEADYRLLQGIVHEVNTPLQFLAINLGFLRHGFLRMARALEAHHAAMGGYPEEVAERLGRLEGELDLEFLLEEIPKVLSESVEGLGTVARVIAAVHQVEGGSPAPADETEA